MTKVEIIEETAAFYNSGNRSTGSGIGNNCLYLGEGGRRCAFSRCCIESPEVDELLRRNERYKNADALLNMAANRGLEILKPEYRGHSDIFWRRLQTFHDLSTNWNEKGLTKSGVTRKNELIQVFS